MPALDSKLRSQLDSVCQQAREKAEEAARSALVKRAVDAAEPHAHFTVAEKVLRNRLRARGRQAGDLRDEKKKTQSIDQLAQELAYEYWHRMLFARFLAENHLLMHPDGVAVSLDECHELAANDTNPTRERGAINDTNPTRERGTINGFVLAARYASKMLPQVFRTDDVLLEMEFAPEHRQALEKLLASLPRETFLADDSLGWVYQFWQTARKKEVNESGNKIDARTISSVTQLFTEDYMVQFLLHNTLGAWWAGRQFSIFDFRFLIEDEARAAVAVPGVNWEYLRFVPVETGQADDQSKIKNQKSKIPFRPAAGTFEGWPKTLKEFTLLDPCCGSGHFLVAAFNLLVPLRMHDEGLSAREACDAVLRENLFGLELDPRCTQIAAFALAVAAWRFPNVDGTLRVPNSAHGVCGLQGEPLGYRELPPLNIACAGIGPQATEDEWVKLADKATGRMARLGRDAIRNGLQNLHQLFSQAPTLGSLINPQELRGDVVSADFETLAPFLAEALAAEPDSVVRRSASQTHDAERRATMDDDAHERAVAAAGMVKAAELLAGEYTLVITNVPYLGRGKQDDTLKQHLEQHYPNSKADLATAFVERCLEFCAKDCTTAIVTPQSWLFLTTYTKLREFLLKQRTWNAVVRLGPNAFQDMNWWAATTALLILSQSESAPAHMIYGADVSSDKRQTAKAAMLRGELAADIVAISQADQLNNPDARIQFSTTDVSTTLVKYANSYQGIGTSDNSQFLLCFWELAAIPSDYRYVHVAPERNDIVSGATQILHWEDGAGRYYEHAMRLKAEGRLGGWKSGGEAWDKDGIAIKVTGVPTFSRYLGTMFDTTMAVVISKQAENLPAIEVFLKSDGYIDLVRAADQAVSLTEHSFLKVPFDLAHWQQVAAEKYPDGLPEPESEDPTQWLFHGRPESSTAPLQAAVARLLGYRWPAELETAGEPEGVSPRTSEIARNSTGADAKSPGANALRLAKNGVAPMRLSARARDLVRRCEELLPLADRDGLVPIPSVRGETPAAERLLELLHAAFHLECGDASPLSFAAEPLSLEACEEGKAAAPQSRSAAIQSGDESPHSKGAAPQSLIHKLLTQAGCSPGTTLDEWLRNAFFEQHCKLFHNRPFIWHIWDGRKDGFGCLVNYHQLNHKGLENLTYSYLQDWITAQAAQAKLGKTGADLRLAAAQTLQDKLKLILTGEPPYDIFVRWKPLSDQSIGWHPDLNDGVRMNIRPFIEAGILRKNPNIKWTKDRGKEPQREKQDFPWFWTPDGKTFTGDRENDIHLSNTIKMAARKLKGAKS